MLELLRTSNVGNSRTIPIIVTTASGSCSKEELMETWICRLPAQTVLHIGADGGFR
ncbi:hypothetical protein [Phocaeicola sartorii]|uniref:hypothetical protein n=1 Tax=Phocaeicola sartorii TaxID=671267 RepID=UPI003F68C881